MSTTGAKLSFRWRVMSFGALLLVYAALSACSSEVAVAAPDPGQITIKLRNVDPKIKIAIARVKETNESASLEQGKLTLQACDRGHTVSVWAPGYSINMFQCNGSFPAYYEISLERLNAQDNPNYAWTPADARFNSILGCEKCHSDASKLLNEYPEWNVDGHARALLSPLFWSTYLGTNVHRAFSQETVWGFSLDGGRFRMPPDASKDYFGPGYQRDYPNSSGNCAFCHAPTAIGATHQEVNLAPFIEGSWGERVNVVTEGVTCDVCHKAIDVSLDSQQLPHIDRPGILSLSFLRPAAGAQFVAGPWSHLDVSMRDVIRTCDPIFGESQFCAPCHYAKFSGVEIYGSYKEWLDSSYSKRDAGFRSCQDCHMPSSQPVEGTASAARGACSPANTSFRNFSHNMMNRDNTGSPILVQGAATVTVDARKEEGKIKVNVAVVNTRAGHKLPTDSPLRHLILVVEARDENDRLLTQVEGPTIPAWGGTGNQPEDYAGQAGVIYGNILKDQDTNFVPAVAYWNPIIPAWDGSDTRLRPNEFILSQYSFTAQSHGEVRVIARLYYRYAFIEIMRQKGWQQPDVLINWDDHIVPE